MDPKNPSSGGRFDRDGARAAAQPPSDWPPAPDFPRHFKYSYPLSVHLSPSARLLAALVLLCLVPRALMACKLDVLCRDGVFYIQIAEAYGRGDTQGGLARMGLNIYPLILLQLHHLGLDWDLAGKAWGVLISSLVVLPLHGWLRRLFDEAVALAACLLYAVHPKMIQWSAELIRDSTFWFFFAAALYFSWRAATEIRLASYLAAGCAISLALHTRFEGWFLYIPLVWWSVLRYRSLARGSEASRPSAQPAWRFPRRTIGAGLLLAVLSCPVFVLLLNVTWLADHPRWELGNFVRLQYVVLWCQSMLGLPPAEIAPPQVGPLAARVASKGTSGSGLVLPSAPAPASPGVAMPTPPPEPPRQRMSLARTFIVFANTLRRGMGAVFGIAWLIGMWSWRHVWLRSEHNPLFAMTVCTLAGIWIHLWYAQATSSRYALTIVLLGSHCAALGWLAVCRSLVALAARLHASSPILPSRTWSFGGIMAVTLLLFTLIGWTTALADTNEGRQREATLGKWVLDQLGPNQSVITSGPMLLLEHYAQTTAQAIPAHASAEWSLQALAVCQPDLAVFSRRVLPAGVIDHLVEHAEHVGLDPIDQRDLPAGHDWREWIVLRRAASRAAPRTAIRPPAPGREKMTTPGVIQ